MLLLKVWRCLPLMLATIAWPLAGLAATPAAPDAAQPAQKAAVCPRCNKAECPYTVGINLAGPEFGSDLPGVEGKNFGWPTAKSLDYWKSKGVRLIRLPIKWERLQTKLMEDLDPTYAGGLKRTVDLIKERDMQVILDLHNYAAYRGVKSTPTGAVPYESLADVWRRLAELYKDNPAVWGYGLMNEPQVGELAYRQGAIDAIRKVDAKTRILLACDGQVKNWIARKTRPSAVDFKDPSDNLWFENHFYFDRDGSGRYAKSYDDEKATPTIGVERAKQFRDFLKEFKLKGIVGEYGVPANPDEDPRWLEALDKTMAFMQENCIPSTYWAGGEYWTPGRKYVIDPAGWKDAKDRAAMRDRPQWDILKKYQDPPAK